MPVLEHSLMRNYISALFVLVLVGCVTQVPNSNYASPGSLNGTLGDETTLTCSTGFSGSGAIACTTSGAWDPLPVCLDIDECSATVSPCSTHLCVNLLGSFACGPQVAAINIPDVLTSMQGGDLLTISVQGLRFVCPCL